MSVAEMLGRRSASASLRIGRSAAHRRAAHRRAAHRRIEVRVIVSGVEEDAFAVSRPDTLAQALKPILRHLDGRTVVEMVGVERRTSLFGSAERSQPLADLAEAMAFVSG